ncbi:hypothetical protein FPRO04_14024 [Fusarium proliferatum]|nr:hypothetical protein FPRO04_14024 [Fusarium proliferatum]
MQLRHANSEIPPFAFDRDKATRAQADAIATGLPPIDWEPREAPSKMVDFCVFYRPEKESAKEQAIADICRTRPAQSINHTDLGDLCKRPVSLSIETKRPNGERDNATLQIETWQSAPWRSLRHNFSRSLPSIEFLPGVIIQGHDWQFVASILDENGKYRII